MPHVFDCPRCGTRIRLLAERIPSRTKCPDCNRMVDVPWEREADGAIDVLEEVPPPDESLFLVRNGFRIVALGVAVNLLGGALLGLILLDPRLFGQWLNAETLRRVLLGVAIVYALCTLIGQ